LKFQSSSIFIYFREYENVIQPNPSYACIVIIVWFEFHGLLFYIFSKTNCLNMVNWRNGDPTYKFSDIDSLNKLWRSIFCLHKKRPILFQKRSFILSFLMIFYRVFILYSCRLYSHSLFLLQERNNYPAQWATFVVAFKILLLCLGLGVFIIIWLYHLNKCGHGLVYLWTYVMRAYVVGQLSLSLSYLCVWKAFSILSMLFYYWKNTLLFHKKHIVV